MNLIRQVRFNAAYTSFLLIDEIPFFLRNLLTSKMLKVDRNSLDISVLEKRLAEAERRIHLLFNEVGDIRAKLTLAKQLKPSTSTSSAVDVSEASTSGVNDRNGNNDDSPPAKRSKQGFNVENGYVVVYCDGACENNGRANAKAGIGVWFGDDNPLNVAQPVNGRATNNTAEIQACIAAIKVIKENGYRKLKIFTDSEFVIKCMTQWIHKWRLNNWKVASGGEVKNKEDLVKLDQLMRTMDDVKFEYVKGHAGVKGNEEADKLARAGAVRYVK